MTLEPGSTITIDDQECLIISIHSAGGGVLTGKRIDPLWRIYFNRPDGSRGHRDCILPDTEVICGDS